MFSPNPRVQRTPQRGARDRAVFRVSFCSNDIIIYRWRRR
jgi:hypothetical protein